jgi:hypothetical protein
VKDSRLHDQHTQPVHGQGQQDRQSSGYSQRKHPGDRQRP